MRNRFENAALFEDGDGFGELAGHIKVVGDGDDAHSRFGADSLDGGHDLIGGGSVEAGSGLVEYKHARFRRDGLGDGHTSTLPSGKRARLPVEQPFDAREAHPAKQAERVLVVHRDGF